MAVNSSPFGPKPQFELATGAPNVGGQLFFYVAGSVNTKQSTYTDSTGGSANTNPIVLNSLGQPANEIWFTAGQAYKVVFAPAGDTDPPSSPIWSIDNLRGINDSSITIDQWVSSGITPTFVSTTQFTMPGDQTSNFAVGRRVKCTVTAGTVYGRISVSAYAALTTVTLVMDGVSVLDSGLSAVSYGILSPNNHSWPSTLIQAGTNVTITYDAYGRPVVASATFQSVATGTIIDFGGSAAPTGYLACDGTSYLRTDYPSLFAAIGVLWGSVDGTHFNVPNFAAGMASVQTAGTVGASTHGAVIAHTHSAPTNAQSAGPSSGSNYVTAAPGTTGSTGGTDNLAAGNYVFKCIKT